MIRLALIDVSLPLARDYARAARRLRNLALTAIVHEDSAGQSQLVAVVSAARTAASLDQLLASSAAEFDAVWIHGPIERRVKLACLAAAAGKHVLVASPMARSGEEAEQIIQACRAAGVTLMVATGDRFRPSRVAVKQSLLSGQLGVLALLRIHAWEPSPNDEEPGDWLPVDGPGQGGIWARVLPALDLANWLFGAPPIEVFAQGAMPPSRWSRRGGSAAPQYLQIQLQFPGGGLALLSVAASLPAGDGYDTLSVIGTTGAAYADDQYQTQLLYVGGHSLAVKTTEGTTMVSALLREFTSAIGEQRDPVVTGVAGKSALQLVSAVYESWRDGQPVPFQLVAPPHLADGTT